MDVVREHGGAFSFVCWLANREEAALTSGERCGFDPSSGRSSESFIGDGVDRSAWLDPGKKSKVVSDD